MNVLEINKTFHKPFLLSNLPYLTGALASYWFYAMAAASLAGIIMLHFLKPIDFNIILKKRLSRIQSNEISFKNNQF